MARRLKLQIDFVGLFVFVTRKNGTVSVLLPATRAQGSQPHGHEHAQGSGEANGPGASASHELHVAQVRPGAFKDRLEKTCIPIDGQIVTIGCMTPPQHVPPRCILDLVDLTTQNIPQELLGASLDPRLNGHIDVCLPGTFTAMDDAQFEIGSCDDAGPTRRVRMATRVRFESKKVDASNAVLVASHGGESYMLRSELTIYHAPLKEIEHPGTTDPGPEIKHAEFYYDLFRKGACRPRLTLTEFAGTARTCPSAGANE